MKFFIETHCDLVYSGKLLFQWYFGGLDRIETGVFEEGIIPLQSKEGCKDQESIRSSITPDPGYQWESDKLTVRHHKREQRGQPYPRM